jgi:hypothetical protein
MMAPTREKTAMPKLPKLAILLMICAFCAALMPAQAAERLARLYAHETHEDTHGVLAPWHPGQNGQLDERLRLGIEVYKRYPWVKTDKAVMAAPDFVYNSHWSITPKGQILIPPTNDWMCGDLSQRAWSIIKGLTDYYRYSGDPIAFLYIRLTADYILDYGLTSKSHPWPEFPISTPTSGKAYGRCKEDARMQLDLCARVGCDILKAYQLTGEKRYLEAARHWGDLFAAHCNFDPKFSPWNRYVNPEVVGWSDVLTGSTAMILEFLDDLAALGYTGQDGAILRAHEAGRAFLRDKILPRWTLNDSWGRTYWDWDNPTMCGGVSICGDYILRERAAFPNWQTDMRNVLTLILNRNGVDPNSHGETYSGAWAFPESSTCCGTSLSYNQYTAGPTLLRYGVLAQDARVLEIGRRMMLMATYDSDLNGVVKDGLFGDSVATGEWSNLAHPWPVCQVLEAISWVPETFAPARENHMVRGSAVVNWIEYAPGRIEYTVFAAPTETREVLRLSFMPQSITADGVPLIERPELEQNGYAVKALPGGDTLVTVRHDGKLRVTVEGRDPQQSYAVATVVRGTGWEPASEAKAFSGTLLASEETSARLALTFFGNQVRLMGEVGPEGGWADIYLDGVRQNTLLEGWNSTRLERRLLYTRSGLANTSHVLEVVPRGTGNPLAKGKRIALDQVQYSAEVTEPRYGAGGGPAGAQRLIFGYTDRQDYIDKQGNTWRPGTEFVIRSGYGKDSVREALWTDRRSMYIGKTADEEIYRYGLHGREFQVNLTVAPGRYRVRLHWADTPLHVFLEKDKDGGRVKHVMNVELNGKRVLEKFNPAEAAGGIFLATQQTYDNVEPRNGLIDLHFTGVDEREAMLQAVEIVPMNEAKD